MNKKQFIIDDLKVLESDRLAISFSDGYAGVVDLCEWIASTKVLRPLSDESFFAQASIGLGGHCVEWNDDIDLAADNLRNRMVEQAGGIGHERLWNWMHVNQLTVDDASAALGLSRRMLMYYRSGEKPIPRTVWLACLGWQAVMPVGDGLPKDLKGFSQLIA